MIGKLPVLAFSVVTALSGQALAGEPRHAPHTPAAYGHGAAQGGHAYGAAGYGASGRGGYGPAPGRSMHVDYSARAAADLRYSDLNRDGWVSLREALDRSRSEFMRSDRDRNRVLSRREVGRPDLARDDWNRDGRVSLREYQQAVRAEFGRFDRNRDGFLARHELGVPEYRQRSAGWWR